MSIADFHSVIVENCSKHCNNKNSRYARVIFYDDEGNELLLLHLHYKDTAISTLTTTTNLRGDDD
jgi:hypothetical protein